MITEKHKKSVNITTNYQKRKFYSCNGRDPIHFVNSSPTINLSTKNVNVDLASAIETANNLSMLIKEMRSNVHSMIYLVQTKTKLKNLLKKSKERGYQNSKDDTISTSKL